MVLPMAIKQFIYAEPQIYTNFEHELLNQGWRFMISKKKEHIKETDSTLSETF